DELAETKSVGNAAAEQKEGTDSAEYNEWFSYDDHVALNKKNFEKLHPQRVPIKTKPGKFYLSYPSASRMPSNCVHPAFYKNVSGIASLDDLATEGYLNAPGDWKQRIDAALQKSYVSSSLNSFRSSVWLEEEVVETRFTMLVALLSAALNNPIIEGGRLNYGVGRYLPVENGAVIGTSDFMYAQAGTNTSRFITEMKTSTSYLGNEPWYGRSRVCQSMGALYYSGVPLLLCSPSSFKLLLESEDRKSLFCYPAGTYSSSPSTDDFVYVLGLLILSTRKFSGASNILPQSPVKKQTKIIPGKLEQRPQQQQQQSSSRILARLARRSPYSIFKTECLE
ncbi:hypothetical protein MP638_006249, partial [Amoeboaphelidium occidentale]